MSTILSEVCHNHNSRIHVTLIEARKLLKNVCTATTGINDNIVEQIQTVDRLLEDAEAVASRQADYILESSNLPDQTLQSTKVLKQMISDTETFDWAKIYASGQIKSELFGTQTSNTYEAGILTFFCKLLKARRVLEVGMFTGAMALALASVPSVERVVSLESEAYLESWGRPYFKQAGEGLNEKIDIRLGWAKDSLNEMIKAGEDPFDLIYIDADKASYSTYVNQIISNKLLAKDGILCLDNTYYHASTYVPFKTPLLYPADIRQDTVKMANTLGEHLVKFNKELCANPQVEVIMLPVEDGLTIVKWKEA